MPEEAGIRAAGISGAQQAPGLAIARVLPPGAFGLLFPLPDARHTRILLQNWIC